MRHTYLLLMAVATIGCATPSVTRNTVDNATSERTERRTTRSLDNEMPPTWLPVPVAGIRVAELRDSWGAARSGGRTHEGIDIMAKRGTPVLSATPGYVTSAHERGLGGKSVTVRGAGGYSHYYAHLDAYGRYVPGDWVETGDTIGYVGNTGNAAGGPPHLHYGINTGGGAINPYPLLTARGNQVAETKSSTAKTSPAKSESAKSESGKSEPATSQTKRTRGGSIDVAGNTPSTGASTPTRNDLPQTSATAGRRR